MRKDQEKKVWEIALNLKEAMEFYGADSPSDLCAFLGLPPITKMIEFPYGTVDYRYVKEEEPKYEIRDTDKGMKITFPASFFQATFLNFTEASRLMSGNRILAGFKVLVRRIVVGIKKLLGHYRRDNGDLLVWEAPKDRLVFSVQEMGLVSALMRDLGFKSRVAAEATTMIVGILRKLQTKRSQEDGYQRVVPSLCSNPRELPPVPSRADRRNQEESINSQKDS